MAQVTRSGWTTTISSPARPSQSPSLISPESRTAHVTWPDTTWAAASAMALALASAAASAS